MLSSIPNQKFDLDWRRNKSFRNIANLAVFTNFKASRKTFFGIRTLNPLRTGEQFCIHRLFCILKLEIESNIAKTPEILRIELCLVHSKASNSL